MDNAIDQISPSVSVVMSVYNSENYLREAIDSVLNQSFSDFEFIIINDGSIDNSPSIINSYSDKRIVLIENDENKGLIYSLNKGIEIAKGKFIARMDADDICLPKRLELQVAEFNANPNAIIVGSDYYLLNGDKETYIKNRNDSDYQKAVLLFTPCFCHPTVMMKNIFSDKNICYDKDYVHAEDYKLWTDLYAFGEFLNVDKPLLKYRHHSFQISNQKNEAQLIISKRIRENYLHDLKFKLSEKQFEVLNTIGDNTFITSIDLLNNIEDCLLHLELQNTTHHKFNKQSFNDFLHKFWLDSCGNSNLGMSAYRLFFKSKISGYSELSFVDKNIFLMKCLIRRFK
jgi:glycosyltransferase involved in cell wall biosynthesis